MSFYIGVDGGGTKTAFSLFDEEKNTVKTVYGSGSNHENLEGSFDEASDVIWNCISELVGEAGISLDDVAFSLMGVAGIDHKYQHDIMCEKLSEKGLRNFAIYNDGFIVVQIQNDHGHGILPSLFAGIFPSVTGNQFIAAFRTGAGNGRDKNTVLADAFL